MNNSVNRREKEREIGRRRKREREEGTYKRQVEKEEEEKGYNLTVVGSSSGISIGA